MDDEFPIGHPLKKVIFQEGKEFDSDELCLDWVSLFFGDRTVTLKACPDADEIEVTVGSIDRQTASVAAGLSQANSMPHWFHSLVNQKLQAVWVCENNQGYQDQVIFAFQHLNPSIAFVAEGSVIKVYRYAQVLRNESKKSFATPRISNF
ncbi:MAG: hypothetical protein HC878_12025 [Leptolyngbyaceae cyanobacterium SL_5_14]|nr:hypothetical protein [Leptolyngbyaceae cyanobacterium SL_5_14]